MEAASLAVPKKRHKSLRSRRQGIAHSQVDAIVPPLNVGIQCVICVPMCSSGLKETPPLV